MTRLILSLPEQTWWRPFIILGFLCGVGLVVAGGHNAVWSTFWLVVTGVLGGRVTAWALGL